MTRRRLVLVLRLVVAAAVIVVVFGVLLPRLVDGDELGEVLGGVTDRWWLALVPLGAFNLVSPALAQTVAVERLGFRRAVASDWASSALTNTVPGGGALAVGLTAAMYRSYGIRLDETASGVVLTGIFDNLVKLTAPALAVAWLATERPVTGTLAQAGVLGAVLAVVAVGVGLVLLRPGPLSDGLIAGAGRLGRPGRFAASHLPRLRDDAAEALSRRWWPLLVATALGQIGLVALLWACVRACGADSAQLSTAAILTALAFGRLVTALPVTPGGLGPMEAGLIGALGVTGSASTASIVAAVILFRAITFAGPIPLGAGALLWWQFLGSARS